MSAHRTRPPRGPVRRAATALVAAGVTLTVGGCSSVPTGHVAVAMDPAGRLLAVVVVCGGQRLATLTLTDETTGTSTTVRPKDSPPAGGTVILTGPIADPRPEGVLDLLDRGHEYTLTGATAGVESDEVTGTLPSVRFRLDTVVRERKLRQGSVLAADADGTALTDRRAFVTRAAEACG